MEIWLFIILSIFLHFRYFSYKGRTKESVRRAGLGWVFGGLRSLAGIVCGSVFVSPTCSKNEYRDHDKGYGYPAPEAGQGPPRTPHPFQQLHL